MMNRADRWTAFYAAALTGLLNRGQNHYPLPRPDHGHCDPAGENRMMEDASRLADHALRCFDGWVIEQDSEGINPFTEDSFPGSELRTLGQHYAAKPK